MQCGVFSLEILGTGSLGTSPSVLAISDNERLLFDCGDGTQRLCTEYGARVSKISRVYLTSNTPHSNGGLGGFLLTRSDLPAGGKTTVIGPPGAGKIVRSFRHFYNRPNCMVSVYEIGCEQYPHTTNDGIKVEPILLGGPMHDMVHMEKKIKRTSPSEIGRGIEVYDSDLVLPGTDDLAFATCYILSLPERRGKFHPEKASKLGVKPGPAYGKLTRGESVTLPDGKIVTPEQCMDEAESPPMAVIVCCPSLAHLQRLSIAPQMIKLQNEHTSQLTCIIHFTPEDILRSAMYQEWTNRFSSRTKHIGVGENVSPLHSMFLSSCRLQCRLSVLDSLCFPFNEPTIPTGALNLDPERWVLADTRTRFNLAPSRVQGCDLSRVPASINVDEERAIAISLLNQSQKADVLMTEHSPPSIGTEPVHKTPEVIFLGTGSAIPSKYRNVTAQMIHWTNDQFGDIMIDCGEGSLAQLARTLGSMGAARERIYNLAFIWISHMHADHHLGLLTILAERIERGNLPPLIVAGPSSLNIFLSEYSKGLGGEYGSNFSQSFIFLDCEAMLRVKQAGIEPPALHRLKELGGLRSAVSVHVLHCYKAYGLVLETIGGWKFVYSGDTEFCQDLVTEGNGANVLVHEATFEDGKEDEAKEKRHSTISQALRAATGMQAKVVIFSHFSQRYPKNPPLPETTASSTIPVFAFDMMTFHDSRAQQIAEKALQFDNLLEDGGSDEDDDDRSV